MQNEATINDPGKALYFEGWYKDEEVAPVNYEDFSKTAKLHVEKIVKSGAQSALDIGCGAGGILLALQSKGIGQVHGVDASIDAIKLAQSRFKKFGDLEGFVGIQGEMTDVETPQTDAVSLHRVLCCFPDYKGLIEKSTEKEAETIVLTYPRNHLIAKGLTILENMFMWIVSRFKKRLKGIKGYNHSTSDIRTEMKSKGYEISYEDTTWYWKTEVYTRIDKKSQKKIELLPLRYTKIKLNPESFKLANRRYSMIEKHIIDTFKILNAPVVLILMAIFDQWGNLTTWIFLAMHRAYGYLWVFKSRMFPDKSWYVEAILFRRFWISSGLIGS